MSLALQQTTTDQNCCWCCLGLHGPSPIYTCCRQRLCICTHVYTHLYMQAGHARARKHRLCGVQPVVSTTSVTPNTDLSASASLYSPSAHQGVRSSCAPQTVSSSGSENTQGQQPSNKYDLLSVLLLQCLHSASLSLQALQQL